MSKLIKEYDDLKKILKSSDGRELYTHLIECFNSLVMHYPDDAMDKFEEVSYLLKDSDKDKLRQFLNFDNKKDIRAPTECLKEYIEKAVGIFPQKPEEGGDPDEQVEGMTAGKLSNLHNDSEILQWAGVGFGQDETFRLQTSLTKLSITTGSEKIRLWGKIYGTQKDYYIAEGFVAGAGGDEEEEKPKGFEERGTGVNEFVYWVTNSSLGEWTMLPDVTPDILNATRSIKVKLTGDLDAKIITNPFFFGTERQYLRAQIARITHSTTIMPGGLHKLTEDNPKEIEPIEFEDEKVYVPSTESQSHIKNWVHAKKSILNCNRVNHLEPDAEEFGDKEPEEIQKILDKRDPPEPRIKAITGDESKSGEDTAWNIRLYGDQTRTPALNGKSNHHGVVVVKSTVWPGSITCWKGDRYIQIYVGEGLKNESISYYPVLPPQLPEDPEDFEEVAEPNPKDAPEEEGEGNQNNE